MPGVGAFFMTNLVISLTILALILVLTMLIVSIAKFFKIRFHITVQFITKTAIFAAISVILYVVPILNFPLPIFPSFLKIHLDEIPAFIAGFAYGPFSSFLILAVKTLIKLPMTSTMGVGELADFVYSLCFVIPAAVIYKFHRNIKGAAISLGIATVIQAFAASIITAFIMLDFYVLVMPGLNIEGLLKICKIPDLGWTFVWYIGMPFNLLKDVMVVFIVFILYKRLHKLIDRINFKERR